MQALIRKLLGVRGMTFQVGLCATDGFVIAGDRKKVQLDGYRNSTVSTKIKMNKGETVVCACSGDDVALQAANFLFDSDAEISWTHPEEVIRKRIGNFWGKYWGEAANAVPPCVQLQAHRTLLIGSVDSPRLFECQLSSMPTCSPVVDKIVCGDGGNPAGFFVERYWRKTSAKKLLFLAAHAVLLAGRLNPAFVEGLEMVICDNGNLKLIGQDEIAELTKRSQRLDTEIADEFLNLPNGLL
jgi:hypothetical protein